MPAKGTTTNRRTTFTRETIARVSERLTRLAGDFRKFSDSINGMTPAFDQELTIDGGRMVEAGIFDINECLCRLQAKWERAVGLGIPDALPEKEENTRDTAARNAKPPKGRAARNGKKSE
jgi:hypothetical protein